MTSSFIPFRIQLIISYRRRKEEEREEKKNKRLVGEVRFVRAHEVQIERTLRSDQIKQRGANQIRPDHTTEGAAPADSASRYLQIRSTTSLPLALFCRNLSAHRVSTFSATAARAASGRHRIVVSCLNCVHSSGRSGWGL